MKTEQKHPGVPASIYLDQDENGDRRAVMSIPEFTCFFCGQAADESEVCQACTPHACEVLGRAVDQCLGTMKGAA
jgi:hypothetical protein